MGCTEGAGVSLGAGVGVETTVGVTTGAVGSALCFGTVSLMLLLVAHAETAAIIMSTSTRAMNIFILRLSIFLLHSAALRRMIPPIIYHRIEKIQFLIAI